MRREDREATAFGAMAGPGGGSGVTRLEMRPAQTEAEPGPTKTKVARRVAPWAERREEEAGAAARRFQRLGGGAAGRASLVEATGSRAQLEGLKRHWSQRVAAHGPRRSDAGASDPVVGGEADAEGWSRHQGGSGWEATGSWRRGAAAGIQGGARWKLGPS